MTFLSKTLRLARSIPGLQQVWLDTLVTGIAVTVVGLIPMALAVLFLSRSIWGGLLAGVFAALILLAQLFTAYVYSGMEAGLISQQFAGETPDLARYQAAVNRRWVDLLSLAAGTLPIQVFPARSSRPAWSRAVYLLRPVMMVEDRDLREAVRQVDQVVRGNMLMMTPSQVAVGWVNAILGAVLALAGSGLGLLAAIGLRNLTHATPIGTALAVAAGVLIASLFILTAAILGSLNAAAYHTCLYQWARQEAQVLPGGGRHPAPPPAPLAETLAGIASLSAPIYSD